MTKHVSREKLEETKKNNDRLHLVRNVELPNQEQAAAEIDRLQKDFCLCEGTGTKPDRSHVATRRNTWQQVAKSNHIQ